MANVRFVRTKKVRHMERIANGECDVNALYFCTDSREFYRADQLLTDGTRIVASYADLPAFDVAADGIVYYVEDEKSGYLLNSTRDGWVLTNPDLSQYATVEKVTELTTQMNTVTEQVESIRTEVDEKIKTEIEEQIKDGIVAGNLDGGEI